MTSPTLTPGLTDRTDYIVSSSACVRVHTQEELRQYPSDPSDATLTSEQPRSRDTVLALDLGTTTGWALKQRDATIISGTQSFKPQRFEGGGMRYLRFKRWLTEIKTTADGIDEVVFEEVRRHASTDSAHVYGGLLATLTAWCEHHHIAYQGIPVGTIKKHATGKGNASKDEMVAAMTLRGHTPADDNEADALALLYFALTAQEV